MYKIEYYDNQISSDIHKEAYEYLQTLNWQARYRHVPEAGINPSAGDFRNDLVPYVAKKTVYRAELGHNYKSMKMHTPIGTLFDYINDTLFNNKFEFNGKPLGMTPKSQISEKEINDYLFDQEHQGTTSYMQAQPYETTKRTRVPHRDWDGSSLDDDRYYTILFVANLAWSPLWHAEMFFYDDANSNTTITSDNIIQNQCNSIAWGPKFILNIPGRVILHDSRMLHSSRATSVLAPELSQRIGFRVKLKEGETLVRN